MELTAIQGDLCSLQVDAIVNPANSKGVMGGGVAGVIKRIGGAEIEKEAVANAPIPVGEAVATTAGKLPCKFVIHAPTMERPSQPSSVENIKKATLAALKCAEDKQVRSLALPGMGTGVGRVPMDKAADAMASVIRAFNSQIVTRVLLVDMREEMVKEFERAIKASGPLPPLS